MLKSIDQKCFVRNLFFCKTIKLFIVTCTKLSGSSSNMRNSGLMTGVCSAAFCRTAARV